jgi:hypothetical protein
MQCHHQAVHTYHCALLRPQEIHCTPDLKPAVHRNCCTGCRAQAWLRCYSRLYRHHHRCPLPSGLVLVSADACCIDRLLRSLLSCAAAAFRQYHVQKRLAVVAHNTAVGSAAPRNGRKEPRWMLTASSYGIAGTFHHHIRVSA